jgi:serine/threonine protein kinase
MGEIYKVHDTRLNRDVALKVLPDSFSSDPERIRPASRRSRHARPRGLALLKDAASDFEILGMPLHRDRARTWRADADRAGSPGSAIGSASS